MSPNENNFLNDDLLAEDTQESGYVPKFERDLKNAGGSLSELTKEKKAEKAISADEIDMEIDTSSLRSAVSVPDNTQEYEIDVEETAAPEDVSQENEADIDFIYGEDENYNYTGNLEEISADSIALEDIDVKVEEMRTDKSSILSSIKNQLQADDLAMSVENRPKLDDMSDEYAPTVKKSSDIIAKDQLDRDEKELIKTRLKTELESKSEGYDKKKSLEMYKKLMAEQKAKAAKHGFVMLLVTAAIGLVAAVLIYFIKPNADGTHPILDYLPIGAIVFSLLMVLKSKFFKILSALYFAACTVLLIYPGLIGYVGSVEGQDLGQELIIKLAMYAVAAILCAITFIRLAANKSIEEYYSYKPDKNNGRR